MLVRYKTELKDKAFSFNMGEEIKIIVRSFLYAIENEPERIYQGKLIEIEDNGFWVKLTSVTIYPYSPDGRMPGEIEQLANQVEFFSFGEVEDVIASDAEYPNLKDPLNRFALDGLPEKQKGGE